jgi:hypothetical protein
MFKFISLFFISLFLISCNEITSPILDLKSKNPLNDNGIRSTESEYVQIGKTYLTLQTDLWNVVDGRYSFKKATIFGETVLDTENHTPGPDLIYKNEFIHMSDMDSLGRYFKYTSTNGVDIRNKTSITFESFRGYTPEIIHGGIGTDGGFIYLIAFLSKSQISDIDKQNLVNHNLLIYKNVSPNNFNNFRLVNTHFIEGATDSWHSILFNEDTKKYYIYGRKRGERDWGSFFSSNQFLRVAMPDRRGVRILEADDIEGSWRELSPVDPINYQINYTNPNHDIRMDYYGGSASYYYGNVLMQINTFFKDKNRVPSTRPERISGTGPLYPTLWHSTDGKEFNPTHPTMVRSLVPLSLHERDWSKYFEETLGYFEVGQIYSAPLMVKDTLVYMFYRNRWDTHYLVTPPIARANPSENWASYIVLDRFSSYQPLDVSCTSIPRYKQNGISDNKCAPAVITTGVLETPEGSRAVGINVDGNFTLRVFNENMELIDEIMDITTNQVSYIFQPKLEYGGIPRKAIIQIELYSGDFYALKFFK